MSEYVDKVIVNEREVPIHDSEQRNTMHDFQEDIDELTEDVGELQQGEASLRSAVTSVRNDFDSIVDVNITPGEFIEYTESSSEVSTIEGRYYSHDGTPHDNDTFKTIYMRVESDTIAKGFGDTSLKYLVVFSSEEFSQETRVNGWDRSNWPEEFQVFAGQYITVGVRVGGQAKIYLQATLSKTITIKESALPEQQTEDIDEINEGLSGLTEDVDSLAEDIAEMRQDASGSQIPTDALLYVNRLPSYYIDPAVTPQTFQEAQGYMDDRIAAIPKKGKQFIFITDAHWDGNQKHSTDLIQYVRKCTGIKKVLFGGDVFGNADTKYLAARITGLYLNESKRAFGRDYIPTVGDHDNNTVRAPVDAFLPYGVIVPMFMDALERTGEVHSYQPYSKLSNYVTPGSDNFNEAMEFFRSVYYIDDKKDEIRYISLNCGNGGDRGAMYDIFGDSGALLLRLQFDWLADTLMHTPAGYDVIVLSHKGPSDYCGTSGKALQILLAQFLRKDPSSYPHPTVANKENIDSWWPHTTRYDFSGAPDIGHLFCLMGHSHYDSLMMNGYTNGSFAYNVFVASGSTITQNNHSMSAQTVQVPVITTTTDSSGAFNTGTIPSGAVAPPMTNGTITEQAFDVITLTDESITMTRFGAGEDRVLYWGQ